MKKTFKTALRALEMPPLVPYGTTFPPAGGLYSSLCVSFILPPLAGEVRCIRIGGCICRRQIIQQNGYFAI